MWLIICFALVTVSLEPPMSSTYTCCRSSSAASGNSAFESLASVLIALVAMSGAGLSPKFSLSHW